MGQKVDEHYPCIYSGQDIEVYKDLEKKRICIELYEGDKRVVSKTFTYGEFKEMVRCMNVYELGVKGK